jgi:hypothetical protein
MKIGGWILFLALALLLVASPSANAEWARTQSETLKGIDSLYVTIENLHPDAAEIGLNSMMLRKDMEDKLKNTGITVPFALIGNDEPYLNVVITLHYDKEKDFVYYALHISVLQPVVLAKSSNQSCYGRTWFISSAGGASKKEAVQIIREDINKKIDTFIKDYLAVNPKKK